jgi:hypothetical protein
MKNLKVLFAMMAVAMFTFFSANDAKAQTSVDQVIAGLLNVNVGVIEIDVETGDITLVQVENVLNNNEIRILNNALNNNEVLSNNQNFLNNLLRGADIITDNQIVVGVLSGGIVVIDDL